ncbi:SIMPL domain-containing protein [Phenylobacterium aquaticum]|uniref:SIMPL domain-containing protein n=1 Tax=Phenylobacterium aquaticum TaxID=1763816 RepID=UPI001F5D3C13|nr:SIMPL domain-containing protein [Phenylobacterium aquaticum]MCI3134814.1 SIMPL domain-containing protein [Phenylobacterium aquaticum]
MRRLILSLCLAAVATPVLAQTAPVAPAGRYDPAPWWMDKPIIASSGYVTSEVTANRATFQATYHVVDRDPAAATKAAADKVKALGSVLAAYGADKVRVATTFQITPLYDQYRDKDGQLVDNERADKIKTYQVAAIVSVEVRDVRLIEQVYATALSAKPSTTQPVNFRLEPDNEIKTQMFRAAVEDAARRARLAVEASGAKLGGVKLIDPTGRACETDVLVAGAGRGGGGGEAYDVAMSPPPPAPMAAMPMLQKRLAETGLNPDDFRLPLQPPVQSLEARACVVFGLAN